CETLNSWCKIAFRCDAGFGSTDFSLCSFRLSQRKPKPHRLKPVLLDRSGPALRILVRNSHLSERGEKSRIFGIWTATGTFDRPHARPYIRWLIHYVLARTK